MPHEGRTLLGEVVEVQGDALRVRHFCGDPWPFTWVPVAAVRVLDREAVTA